MSGRSAGLLATPVAGLVLVLLKLFAPDPWGGPNLVPIELAGMTGTLVAVSLVARGSALWTRRRDLLLLAFGTALLFLVGIIETSEQDMLSRRHVCRWIPILAGSGFVVWTVGLALEHARGWRIAAVTAVHEPLPGEFWAEIKGNKDAKKAGSAPRRRVLQLIGLLLLVPALVRRRDLDAFALALFAVFLAVALSRSCGSTWALLFLVGAAGSRGDPDREPGVGSTERAGLASVAGLVCGSVMVWLAASFCAPGRMTASYFHPNWGMYLLFAGLCIGYLVGDLRAWLVTRSGGAVRLPRPGIGIW